jgi:hypothetical protein
VRELKYIDSIDESDKNMLLRKEEKKEGRIFNVVQQNSSNQVNNEYLRCSSRNIIARKFKAIDFC